MEIIEPDIWGDVSQKGFYREESWRTSNPKINRQLKIPSHHLPHGQPCDQIGVEESLLSPWLLHWCFSGGY
jgi:hypothetical protein